MPATIKIALDCRDINIATTGTHTYLSELIAAFNKQQNNQVSFVFIKPFIAVMPGNNVFGKLIRHFQFFFYKQITLPILTFLNGASVLICTDYVAPVFMPGFKTIVVFHDAFFWEYPQHYSALWLRMFKAAALAGAKKSMAIIAPSEYAKKQIALHTGINVAHIKVVYEAPKTFAQTLNVDIEHHHHEQEQHHHRAHIHQHQGDGQELCFEQHPKTRCLEKRQHQIQGRMHGVAGRDDPKGRKQHDHGEQVKQSGSGVHGIQRYLASAALCAAISRSYRSPTASSMSLVKYKSPRFSPWYSKMWVSTMESTGQLSSQKPQKMHLVRSMS